MEIKDFLNYKMPVLSKNELLQKELELFEKMKQNPNNMSYWLPKIKDKGFHIPDTIIIPLSFEQVEWLSSDKYSAEAKKSFTNELLDCINKLSFDTDRELFIKTGNFSNKFVFEFCHLKDLNEIGEQFLNVFYGAMFVGCDTSPELVVREFIHTNSNRGSIYNGMKLNTEFRMFYDFDKKKLLDIFNYWDREVMTKHLHDIEDKEVFLQNIDTIENDFNSLKESFVQEIEGKIETINLTGIWSVDFMHDGEKFWLIDMALGQQSYYYNKLKLS